jgi:signal-transduction protein with cAMP-binding, CBS, and nucleotidyltransferase domain
LKSSPAFLKALYLDGEEYGVALGWFGRFITEKSNPDHLGKINLKHTGTLPLVQATRLLALRAGVPAVSTTQRLEELSKAGVIDSDAYDRLTAAFGHITRLLLRQQIADFKAGNPTSNYVHPNTLRERERDMLVDSFRAIEALRERLKSDFTGDVF